MTKQTVARDPKKVERIMQTAVKLFAKYRYQHTKVDDIAKAAAVSKGIIFHYYQNKAGLYIAMLQYANQFIMDRADLTVWQNSEDLTDMIVRATAYKIKLQMKYPDEFKVLIDVYGGVNELNSEVQNEAKKIVSVNNNTAAELIAPVLDRIQVDPKLDRDDVYRMLDGIMLQIEAETKQHFEGSTSSNIEDLTEIIEHAKTYIAIFERGIRA